MFIAKHGMPLVMRCSLLNLTACVLFASATSRADPPGQLITSVPIIGGRAVPEIVVTRKMLIGRQHPGMPIVREIILLPNRFVPVREDAEGFYFQAVAQFQPVSGANPDEAYGGLYLNKKHPERVSAYVGQARSARFAPRNILRLQPDQVRQLKLARALRTPQ
ncbi:MAG TPA: hypothetical protein VG095_02415 [Chthoniobacterales bacterium]|nr:hypothetical protein [Chthoniobacterales bacterium]